MTEDARRQLACGAAALIESLTEQSGIALSAQLIAACNELEGRSAEEVSGALVRSLLAPRLAQLLDEGDASSAQHALTLLAGVPEPSLAGIATALARVQHRDRRRSALDAITVRGLIGVQAVAQLVRDSDGAFALDLVGVLSRVPANAAACQAATEGLLAGIAHKSSQVRFDALRYLLARVRGEEAARHAMVALGDGEAAVRRVAQEYLIQIAPADAAPAVEKLVRDPKWGKRDLGERRRLLLAYGRLGGTPAVKLLIDILERRRKEPDELREAAAEVLAIIRAQPARPVLERIAGNKKEPEGVREAAARAAKAIAAAPRTLQPTTAPAPRPAPPIAPARPAPRPDRPVEIPFATAVPHITGLPVAEPLPFEVVGTPAPATGDEPARVDDAWAPEPPSRPQLAPEVASLLQDYLTKTDPGIKPWPTAEPQTEKPTLAAVKLKKVRRSDLDGDD